MPNLSEPPTGIVRTLPAHYWEASLPGARRFRACVERMAKEDTEESCYIALSSKPKHEVLHLYLCIGGQVRFRFNLAGFQPGQKFKSWDGTHMRAEVFAHCCGPVSTPPEPVRMRGFQGFRYVSTPLW